MQLTFDPNDPRDTADMFNHLRAMGKIDQAVEVQVSDVAPDTNHVDTVPAPLPVGVPTPGVSPQAALAAVGAPIDDAVELDANGMPWNEAYHSGGRTKTAKKVWKARSGKGDEAKAALAAHMAAQSGQAPAPVAAVPVAAVPVAAVAPVAVPAAPVVPVAVAPVAVPAALPTPVAPAAPVVPSFEEFTNRFVAMMTPGEDGVTPAKIPDAQAVYTALGITAETQGMLQTDDATRLRAWQYLDQLS